MSMNDKDKAAVLWTLGKPTAPPPALVFARAHLGRLVGCRIVAVDMVPGVDGPTPGLVVEMPNGRTVAIVARRDAEENGDGFLQWGTP